MNPEFIEAVKPDQIEQVLQLLSLEDRLSRANVIDSYFTDSGANARSKYRPHVDFMNAGAKYSTRCLVAGNRTGKSLTASAEMSYQLTGNYPHWFVGRRFTAPIVAMAVGLTARSTRDVNQELLLGPVGAIGSGMIPGSAIISVSSRAGLANAADMVQVRHASGGISQLYFRSAESGAASFAGLKSHFSWIDEECDEECFGEIAVRGMTVKGLVVITFTPIAGITPLVQSLMFDDNKEAAGRYVQTITWDQAPHIPEEEKAKVLANTPPWLRESREKGRPSIGAGAIYGMAPSEYLVTDFPIPEWYRQVYGMDFGWKFTAAAFLAQNPETGVWYVWSEHKQGAEQAYYHSSAILARGDWIPGVCDPSGLQSNQKDGTQLIEHYRDLGLKLQPADNAVEKGILLVWQLLTQGKLKIFKSCVQLQHEMGLYHRDVKTGKPVKANDHLLDALRYALVSGTSVATAKPVPPIPKYTGGWSPGQETLRWMA